MTTPTLQGRRVLVVGASSGIGRAFAIRAVRAGAKVAMVARRADRLNEVIAEAGGGDAIEADLRESDDCARIGVEAGAILGRADVVFVTAGASRLSWVDEATPEDWQVAFETNVIGVNLAIRGLLPVLEPGALVAACSSESVGHPRAGLVTYGSSKAALEESLRGWRVEHPEVRFGCVTVGATVPTEFGSGWDPVKLGRALELWALHGLAKAELMQTDHVAEVLVNTFGVAAAYPGVCIEQLTIRSPASTTDTSEGDVSAAMQSDIETPSPLGRDEPQG